MQLLISIHDYAVENALSIGELYAVENTLSIGELNLFSSDNRDEVNRKVVDYLKILSHQLQNEPNRPAVSLGDAFRLQFRVKENDNDTNWVERINQQCRFGWNRHPCKGNGQHHAHQCFQEKGSPKERRFHRTLHDG